MSAIESFHGASSPLRYFPKFIQSQVEVKVMEHVERKFEDEIRLHNAQGAVLVYVHRLFKEKASSFHPQPVGNMKLSTRDEQVIESAADRAVKNAAYDYVLAGVDMDHTKVVDTVYMQYLASDFESRWALAKSSLYSLVIKAEQDARQSVLAMRPDDFDALRHYIRHYMPDLLHGLETRLVEGIYDKLCLQWHTETLGESGGEVRGAAPGAAVLETGGRQELRHTRSDFEIHEAKP
ncbi:hypothetical protein LY78DRAFT_686958 [Colletotrichum sublineola]|nr:hypothetical protein LY78DRAFT_686958 [Colletotrichum sublineola]